MAEWITVEEAADSLGVHISAIPKMIRRGDLTKRPQRPILNRAQVLAYRDARLAAQQTGPRTRPTKGPPTPPDNEHEWLSAEDVGAIMGLSRVAVMARARREHLPSVVANNRRWFREDHLHLLLRAQNAKERRQP
jgi:hypothetical protein